MRNPRALSGLSALLFGLALVGAGCSAGTNVNLGGTGVDVNTNVDVTLPPDQVACTLEAKQCPDGSYVGRVPPSCEFAPCPPTQ